MFIVVKEETKLGTEYTTLKDDSGKPINFKNLGAAEDRLKEIFENGNGSTSFVLMKG